MRRYACLGTLAITLGGCGAASPPLFTVQQVQKAFTNAGFNLGPGVTEKGHADQPFGGIVFSVKAGSQMFVIVFESTKDAEAAYKIEHGQAATDSFDRVTGNLLVTTDGLSSRQHEQIRRAIAALAQHS